MSGSIPVVTHAAVLRHETRLTAAGPPTCIWRAADQFRGWFQSIPADRGGMAEGSAPYREVCTHGWVVDGEGKKMSKIAGQRHGAAGDHRAVRRGYPAAVGGFLRLSLSDIRVSGRISSSSFPRAYRKIRNTARFILGNLDDFDPNTDCVADDQLPEIDRWALAALDDLIVNTDAGYAVYDLTRSITLCTTSASWQCPTSTWM